MCFLNIRISIQMIFRGAYLLDIPQIVSSKAMETTTEAVEAETRWKPLAVECGGLCFGMFGVIGEGMLAFEHGFWLFKE